MSKKLKYHQYRKILLLFSSIMFSFAVVYGQQTITVSGVVTSSENSPIAAVNVTAKGTNKGVATNKSGAYTITVNKAAVLVFSSIGFEKKEVAVGNQTVINVSLDFNNQNLDQVVVVAYGKQKKATVTGAIASIGTKELKQSPAANLAASLAGRLPGLTAIQSSGEPGKDAVSLYLRGQGTINGQTPVILVDGVPRDLTYIDPNEVESVTILKDASSTAMFGVRGANGVILVTTRRGKTNKPEISFSAETGAQEFTRLPNILSSFEWATLRNQENTNDGNPLEFSQAALDHFRLQDDPTHYPNNNYQKMLMRQYVGQQRYNLNLSGGTEYVNYFINAGYLDQGGQWKVEQTDYDPSSYLKRYNFRSNIDVYLNKSKTLKTFLNLGGYVENVNSPAGSNAGLGFGNAINALVDIFNTPPITPGPLTPDGRVLVYKNNNSPYGDINRSGYVQETRSNILSSFGMEQDLKFITPGLSARFMISFDTKAIHDLTESQSYSQWNQAIVPGSGGQDSTVYVPANGNQNSTLNPSVNTTFQTYSNLQLFINYSRTFGKHTFTGLILGQQDKTIKPQQGDNPSSTDFPLPFNLRGLSSRITYGYENKYFAEFNMGYNGSEQFAKGRRYGFFPSVSAGWLISGENFMKNISAISLLKIRGSYGEVGNDRINNNRFLYLDNTIIQGGGWVGGGGTLGINGNVVNEAYVGNPLLTWETSKKSNIGLELGLFNQLNLTVDIYKSINNNMLINRGTVPQLNGLPNSALPPQNIGRLVNQGYEIELDYNKSVNRNLSLLGKLNFNYSKNKLEFVDEPKRTPDYAYQYYSTGNPVGQFFGLISDGFWNSQDEIDHSNLTFAGRAPRPGDLKFKDLTGDGIIDQRDFGPIGYSNVPQYSFGATVGVNYKNFDLSMLFQGVANVTQDFRGWGVWENYGSGFFSDRHLNAWTPERAANGSPISYPALSASNSSSQAYPSDYWLENTSYLRLKNVELGYNLPVQLVQKIGAKKVRVYANGFNLFTWDKMINKGYDPESPGPLTYPIYKIYNLGVNIVF
ncbi:TonB-linked SusC/RagA family outer membrane protein [Pedobacter sp. UYP30]|uniref:SusC/RagA family TonB-linked outer membrane protein n=1 Tax=Pedobacter sp. UYP30 TaxID=1756400 RepID=UPI0033980674